MDWAQILVYLLAILFGLFLTVAIVLVVLIMKVTRQIKSVTDSAQRTVNTLEDSVASFQKTAVPLMIAKGLLGQVAKRSKRQKKTDRNEQ